MANYNRNELTGDLAPVNAELEKIEVAIAEQYDRLPSEGEANQLGSTLDVNSQQVINLAQPTNPNDAARLKDVLEASQTGLPDQAGQSGKVLKTDGTAATWENETVTSVHGRIGAVTSSSGDYSIGQITGAATVASTNSYDDLDDKPSIPSIFCGEFDQSGNSVFLPSGWSVVRAAAGTYDVTISPAQADTNYAVAVSVVSTVSFLLDSRVQNKTTTGFRVVVKNASGVDTDEDVNFILSRN